ncbi:MAG: hypothetical protein K8T91_03040 [Planctomycetes bacterium]|nr:hypothetical protein [Planctomycetota bacterium]
MGHPIIAVVRRETRLEGLKARWATAKAAAFRMKQAVRHEKALRRERRAMAEFDLTSVEFTDAMVVEGESADSMLSEALAAPTQYEEEDEIYQRALKNLTHELDALGFPVKVIDRTFVPNFDFFRCLLVVVIGPDGLVANVAKYVGDLPIIGINPDPSRNDGVLLPFEVRQARSIVRRTIDRRHKLREVTLAEATTNEGQRMLAFNDFYVGSSSHVSARYILEMNTRVEQQSSSGVLISTGAGSTGWLSSVFNMAEGINRFLGHDEAARMELKWEDRRLVWAVREPFRSCHSEANTVAGFLDEGSELVLGSQMPTGGVIFSDGIETDFLEFNSGTIARFTVAQQCARLVVG